MTRRASEVTPPSPNYHATTMEEYQASTELTCIVPLYTLVFLWHWPGCGSPVAKVSDHVMSSSPVSLKTCRVVERCTLNLPRAQKSSRWCGVVVKGGGASSGVVFVT
ncbi:hypothetical protein TNCV_2419141 [Trichonephila clavipes]|nr:hypothetical protein TNCV_2419141 [Trichonephila clavipes]